MQFGEQELIAIGKSAYSAFVKGTNSISFEELPTSLQRRWQGAAFAAVIQSHAEVYLRFQGYITPQITGVIRGYNE